MKMYERVLLYQSIKALQNTREESKQATELFCVFIHRIR